MADRQTGPKSVRRKRKSGLPPGLIGRAVNGPLLDPAGGVFVAPAGTYTLRLSFGDGRSTFCGPTITTDGTGLLSYQSIPA